MCEFCEKDGLLEVEIVYKCLVRVQNEYFGNITIPKDIHIKPEKCPICGRELRSEENER